MKTILTIVAILILFLCSQAWAASTTYYVTQAGSGTADGKSYANSWAMTDFHDVANWSGSDDANKIDSDDTVYICDAITTALYPRAGYFTSGELIIRGDLAGHAGVVTVSSGYAVLVQWYSYVTFRNLTFKNTGSGVVVQITTDNVDVRTNIKFHDCTIQAGNAGTATLIYGIKFANPAGGSNIKSFQNIWIYNNDIEHMYKGQVDRNMNIVARPSDGISIYVQNGGLSHGPFYIHHNHIKGFFHGQIVFTAYDSTYTSVAEAYIWENEFDGESSHADSYMRGISICSQNSFVFRNYLHDLTVRNQIYYGDIHYYNNVYAESDTIIADAGGAGYVGGGGAVDTLHSNHRIYNNTYYSIDESAIYMAWNGAASLDLVDIRNNVFHDCGSGNSGNRASTSTTPSYAYETICFRNSKDSDYIDSIIINNNIFYPVTGARTEDILLYDKNDRTFSGALLTVAELNAEGFAEVAAANNLGPAINPSISDPANEVFKYDADGDPGVDAGDSTLTGPSTVGLNPPSGVAMGYDDGIHPDTDFTDFINTVKSLKHSGYGTAWDIGAVVYQKTEEDPPVKGNNNFSGDTDCIGWWELEGDATDSAGSDDLSSGGNPTYSAVNGDRGVILDGNDDLHIANLTGNVTADFTVYAKFKFDAEIVGNAYEAIAVEWDGTAQHQCWWLGLRDSDAGNEDEIIFMIGDATGAGTTATIITDTTYDLVHGTVYSVIATYDNTNDDIHIYLYDSDGSNLLNTDPGTWTMADDINNEDVYFYIGYDTANYLTGTVYEVAILTKEATSTEAENMAKGQYSGSSLAVTGMTSVSSNITSAGTLTWAIGWNREPFTEGGAWTIGATFDYPVAEQTMSYTAKWNRYADWEATGNANTRKKLTYIEPTTVMRDDALMVENDGNFATLAANEWDWVGNYLYIDDTGSATSGCVPSPWETYVEIDTLAGWRQDSFGDAQISANITLPTGVTIVDSENVAGITTGALTGLGTYPANTVTNPSTATDPITFGTGGDLDKISDLVGQVNGDIYTYLSAITDNVDITANSTLITYGGRAAANTGTLTFTGDNNHVRCVLFSGAITYTGTGNTYHPICGKGVSRMGMAPR